MSWENSAPKDFCVRCRQLTHRMKCLPCTHLFCLDRCLPAISKISPGFLTCTHCNQQYEMSNSDAATSTSGNSSLTSRSREVAHPSPKPEPSSAQSNFDISEKCADHGETLAAYCKDCSAEICATCIGSDHMTHSFESLKAKVFRDFKAKFESINIDDLQQDLAKKSHILSSMESEAKELVQTISREKRILQNALTNCNKCLENEEMYRKMSTDPKLMDAAAAQVFFDATCPDSLVPEILQRAHTLDRMRSELMADEGDSGIGLSTGCKASPNRSLGESLEARSADCPDSSSSQASVSSVSARRIRKAKTKASVYQSHDSENAQLDFKEVDTMTVADAIMHKKNSISSAFFDSANNLLYINFYYFDLVAYTAVSDGGKFSKVATLDHTKVTDLAIVSSPGGTKIIAIAGRSNKCPDQKVVSCSSNLKMLQTLDCSMLDQNGGDWLVASQGSTFLICDQISCYVYESKSCTSFTRFRLPVVGPLCGFKSYRNKDIILVGANTDSTYRLYHCCASGNKTVVAETFDRLKSPNFVATSLMVNSRSIAVLMFSTPRNNWSITIKSISKNDTIELSFGSSISPLALISTSTVLLQDGNNRNRFIIAHSTKLESFLNSC